MIRTSTNGDGPLMPPPRPSSSSWPIGRPLTMIPGQCPAPVRSHPRRAPATRWRSDGPLPAVMQQFLETQRAVMLGYLGAARAPRWRYPRSRPRRSCRPLTLAAPRAGRTLPARARSWPPRLGAAAAGPIGCPVGARQLRHRRPGPHARRSSSGCWRVVSERTGYPHRHARARRRPRGRPRRRLDQARRDRRQVHPDLGDERAGDRHGAARRAADVAEVIDVLEAGCGHGAYAGTGAATRGAGWQAVAL